MPGVSSLFLQKVKKVEKQSPPICRFSQGLASLYPAQGFAPLSRGSLSRIGESAQRLLGLFGDGFGLGPHFQFKRVRINPFKIAVCIQCSVPYLLVVIGRSLVYIRLHLPFSCLPSSPISFPNSSHSFQTHSLSTTFTLSVV
jgi:hypothetical protein